jgi:hypothetical protein
MRRWLYHCTEQQHVTETRNIKNTAVFDVEPADSCFRRIITTSSDSALRPFLQLGLAILPWIPTSVGCESSFSDHNNTLRVDRSCLSRENTEAYIILKSSNLSICSFSLDAFKHLLPFITREGDVKKQEPHIVGARKASKRRYAGGVSANI